MPAEMSYRDGSGVFVRFPDQYPDLVLPWIQFAKGQSWDVWVGDESDEQVMRFDIVDHVGITETPAGVHQKCTAVRVTIPDDEVDYFHFAPGVGLVRVTHSTLRGDVTQLRRDWLLMSYSPGK